MIPLGDENPFRDNPYASPDVPTSAAPAEALHVQPPSRGLVKHVKVVSILMVAQGALEVLMGLAWISMAVFWPQVMQDAMARQGGFPGGPPPAAMIQIMLAMFVCFGLLVLCLAGLHIVAGVRNYSFRSRVLGIIALIGGMTMIVFGCYCAPTGIALGVYGLICYFNPAVVERFDWTIRATRVPVGISDRSLPGRR